MSTVSRALISIVPSFMVAAVMLWFASIENARALDAARSSGLDAAASYEVAASIYVVGAVMVMCLGPALWLIATRYDAQAP